MKTYHVNIYLNDRAQRMVHSIGIELRHGDAHRIARDLNTALAVLGVHAFAEVVEEDDDEPHSSDCMYWGGERCDCASGRLYRGDI